MPEDKIEFPCKELINEGKCDAYCCGCVPIKKETYERIKDKAQGEIKEEIDHGNEIWTFTKDGICPFLKEDKTCAIYEDRPDICRNYGKIPSMPCAFIKPNGRRRSPAKVRRWKRKIAHDIEDKIRSMDKRIGKK